MGFGTSAYGLSPFGYGTPTAAGIVPTAGAAGVRWLNSGSRDFEQDPDTLQLKQMPALRQRVLLKLLTTKGSVKINPGFGVGLPRKMGTGFEREMADAVKVAFEQETQIEKVMRLDAVEVVKLSSGRAQITVSYTDLTTGEEDEVTI
jgi:phage baseplate assembly protein W